MQLIFPQFRFMLVMILWLITLLAFALWLGSSQVTHITLVGGPKDSESLSHAIADTLNEADLGLKMSVFETGGSTENLRLLESRRVAQLVPTLVIRRISGE